MAPRESAGQHPPCRQLDQGGFACMLLGRSLVEEGISKVSLEMFNSSEEELKLNKNTHLALVHPVEVEARG